MNITKVATTFVFLISIGINYQSCGSKSGASSDSSFTISPTEISLYQEESYQFSVSGGSGEYSYSISPEYGSITSDGYYTAPDYEATVYVTVLDSSTGESSTSTISVSDSSNSLTISPSSVTLDEQDSYQFEASGGSGDYSYYISPSNDGSITSYGYYTAPNYEATVYIYVEDNDTGETAYSVVTVSEDGSTSSSDGCNSVSSCKSIAQTKAEIDARTTPIAKTNAQGICWLLNGYSSTVSSYEVTTHSISCGDKYGLAQWYNGSFRTASVSICSSKEVTVLSEVNCN